MHAASLFFHQKTRCKQYSLLVAFFACPWLFWKLAVHGIHPVVFATFHLFALDLVAGVAFENASLDEHRRGFLVSLLNPNEQVGVNCALLLSSTTTTGEVINSRLLFFHTLSVVRLQ